MKEVAGFIVVVVLLWAFFGGGVQFHYTKDGVRHDVQFGVEHGTKAPTNPTNER